MTSKIKSRITFLLFLVLALTFLFFLTIRFFVKPEIVENRLIPKLEEIISGKVEYAEAKLHYFPKLSVELRDMKIDFVRLPGASFEADSLQLHAYVLPAVLGKASIRKIEVDNGSVRWLLPPGVPFKRLEMDEIDFNLSSLKRNSPMKLEMRATLEGVSDAVTLKGWVTLAQENPWSWNTSSFDGDLKLENFPVRILEQRLREQYPVRLKDGLVTLETKLKKDKDSGWLEVIGNLSLQKFIYEIFRDSANMASPEISGNLGIDFGWNRDLEELDFKRMFLKLPIGLFELSGQFAIGTGEVDGIRISATEVAMESLPQYYLPLKKAIPFNLGFSGLSDLEMTVEGALDHLSLHANWDLTPTLLTYTRFVNKPKDYPFTVTFDYLLQDGNILSGDFSLRAKDALVKGAISDLNLRTHSGQLNIITNKFGLNQIEPLILPLEGYTLEGEAKVLLNLKGNFSDASKLEQLLNVTIENGGLQYQEGRKVDDIVLALDYSPLALDIRKFQFVLGEAPAVGKVRIYNLFTNPSLQGEMTAEEFQISLFTKTLHQMLTRWLSEEKVGMLRHFNEGLVKVFPEGVALKNIQIKVESENSQWEISEAKFQVYDGDVRFQATMDYDSQLPTYWVDYKIDRLSLAKVTGLESQDKKIMNGSLFMESQFVGAGFGMSNWQDRIQGEGTAMITNGEFNTMSLPAVIGEVEQFRDPYLSEQNSTLFSDLKFRFTLRNGKFLTEDLVLVSPDFYLEGVGDLAMNGFLNFRLETYFSPKLTERVIASKLGRQFDPQEQFGPVSLLLSGQMDNPNLQLDSSLLADLLDRLERGDGYRAFRRILPEDDFFPRAEDRR